jgi:hypothetical protein
MVRKWSTGPISLSYTTPGPPRLCSLIDGPEVEHGAHFLILHYPRPATHQRERGARPALNPPLPLDTHQQEDVVAAFLQVPMRERA